MMDIIYEASAWILFLVSSEAGRYYEHPLSSAPARSGNDAGHEDLLLSPDALGQRYDFGRSARATTKVAVGL
jgi:hypothetical protein